MKSPFYEIELGHDGQTTWARQQKTIKVDNLYDSLHIQLEGQAVIGSCHGELIKGQHISKFTHF